MVIVTKEAQHYHVGGSHILKPALLRCRPRVDVMCEKRMCDLARWVRSRVKRNTNAIASHHRIDQRNDDVITATFLVSSQHPRVVMWPASATARSCMAAIYSISLALCLHQSKTKIRDSIVYHSFQSQRHLKTGQHMLCQT